MEESMIRLMCPNLKCRRVLAVAVSARGKTVRCSTCGTFVRIPPAAGRPAPLTPDKTSG